MLSKTKQAVFASENLATVGDDRATQEPRGRDRQGEGARRLAIRLVKSAKRKINRMSPLRSPLPATMSCPSNDEASCNAAVGEYRRLSEDFRVDALDRPPQRSVDQLEGEHRYQNQGRVVQPEHGVARERGSFDQGRRCTAPATAG